MKSVCTSQRRRGVVLIVVLLLIVLLAVLIVQFQFSMGVEKQIAINRADELSAAYDLRSSLELARLAILQDLPIMPPQDNSAPVEQPFVSDAEPLLPEIDLGFTLIDASSRLNINMLVTPKGLPDETQQNALRNVLLQLDADSDLVEKITDLIDPDTDEGDFEERYYLNRPLQNMSELAVIEDFPVTLLAPLPETKGLNNFYSVFAPGTININTASPEVLKAILKNPDDELAIQSIIEARQLQPFLTVKDVYEVEGISRGIFGDFESKLTVKPTVFIVELEAARGIVVKRAEAVFRKQGRKAELLYYMEE